MLESPPHQIVTETARSRQFPILAFRGLVLVVLAVGFTLLCVAESRRVGRLVSAPVYDDVVYFYQGALLLDAVRTDGLRGGWRCITERGLHSPYATFLAAASYAALGWKDAAPYYGNGVLVAAYLAGIGWLFRRLSTGAWVASLLLFLTPPMITMAVVEFRPDVAWGLVTGFGVVLIVTSEELFRRPRRAAAAGFVLGLALLVKPSTFAMTFLLFLGAILSRVAGAMGAGEWRRHFPRVIAGAGAFLATVLVVAGPYGAGFGRHAWNYFMVNSFGANQAIWAFTGNRSDALLYYITGDAGRSNVGKSGSLIALLGLASLIYLAVKKPKLRWRLAVPPGLCAGALAINTAAPMKSAFLGEGIYGVLFFGCAYLMAAAYEALGPHSRRGREGWRALALALVAIIALDKYRWPLCSNFARDKASCENYRAADAFMRSLLDRHQNSPPLRIYFLQSGPIVCANAGRWCVVRKYKTVVNAGAWLNSEEQFRRLYPRQDWVVLQEPGMMGGTANLPSERLLPRFLEIIKADSNYGVLAEFVAGDGKKAWVYARGAKER